MSSLSFPFFAETARQLSPREVIPIQPLNADTASRLTAAALLARLPQHIPVVALRAPDLGDTQRWKTQRIGGVDHVVAQPVTLTPYASAQPCSARCRFCSETLIDTTAGKPSSALRPGPQYFTALQMALRQLEGLPLSYSLSGLETTDDAGWMLALLDVLQDHAARSQVNARVLYTNGAGLADDAQGAVLRRRLGSFGVDWVELSRHHFNDTANQAIMRFRSGIQVREQQVFEAMLKQLAAAVPVKLVCIVQQGGIASVEDVIAYLDWAVEQGARSVIFREFSRLDQRYAANVTARYLASSRVAMDTVVEQCLASRRFAAQFVAERVTEGYYFWNIVGRYRNIEVVFEASDYGMMHRQHESGRVYKLVFHANGNLCADWNPERHVLWRFLQEQQVDG